MTDHQTHSPSETNDDESPRQDDESLPRPPQQWVVGESFQHASVQPDFTTAAQLRDRLRRQPPDQDNPLRIRPGLGVDDTEWGDLTSELLKTYGTSVLPEGRPPTAVPRHSVLKHSRDNVLIGDAHVEGDTFQAQLAVVNDTEMLRDHTADQQHVPGMLLIEASIQLVTWAVSEIWLPPAGHPPYYAVMHASAFEFSRFVFPLPTRLTGTFTRTGPAEDDKIPLSAEVLVHQAGQDCSRVRIDLHAFRPALVFAIEDGQARRTLLRAAPAA
ncbi:AfsA-related hotdog domain-containing protein [Streptomyces sp. NPDC087856]|uniref:AfsA-related hotdog domain-containing protein n=1 Tax=Streptomyces sp. NPDC087856 TaxID=3365811 RepID=UPI00381EF536